MQHSSYGCCGYCCAIVCHASKNQRTKLYSLTHTRNARIQTFNKKIIKNRLQVVGEDECLCVELIVVLIVFVPLVTSLTRVALTKTTTTTLTTATKYN